MFICILEHNNEVPVCLCIQCTILCVYRNVMKHAVYKKITVHAHTCMCGHRPLQCQDSRWISTSFLWAMENKGQLYTHVVTHSPGYSTYTVSQLTVNMRVHVHVQYKRIYSTCTYRCLNSCYGKCHHLAGSERCWSGESKKG